MGEEVKITIFSRHFDGGADFKLSVWLSSQC